MATEQALAALERANAIRLAQVAALRVIRNGTAADAAELLRDPDETQGSIILERVLLSVDRYGRNRISRLLNSVGIPQMRMKRRVRELTERERESIAAALLVAWERRRVAA